MGVQKKFAWAACYGPNVKTVMTVANVIVPGGKQGEVQLPDQVVPITGTFAPKVTIKDSVAIQASPGLSNVQGVSRILSLPVVAYVNRAGFIRDGMLKTVNVWMAHMRTSRAKAG